jgi:hypothetical protein
MNKKPLHFTSYKIWASLGLLFVLFQAPAQDFLHTEGKYIYDKNGNEVILRGIGTGNWMIQEGYMMQTSSVAGTQHEFRNKLEAVIGETLADSFYTVWLDNHLRKVDIDSMKAWGFNSIRPALHYYWFTPPIEDEPVAGEITWRNKGFELLDSLINWCTANEMYVILDMHGAPGGQGKDANISDYDPAKPSLWESDLNKAKLVALWKKIAERCADEPYVGGYDLINEPNWTFSESNYAPLWNLYKDITTAIREVDSNHMVIVEGNWFANDFNGLPAIWDDNLVLSFHKYWTYNTQGSIDWMIQLRNSRNVPIWLGESGENSNTWFTELIALVEKNHIGWSWWPIKKPGINNILQSEANTDYLQLIEYWKGNTTKPTVEAAFQAVLTFALNHKLENCTIHRDVIDAMMRQPGSMETLPYKTHLLGEPIFAAEYDLGRNNVAYFDTDTANYNLSTGTYVNWNAGWGYRNDGVDIEACSDTTTTHGYNVGWTASGEWLQYSLQVPADAAYKLDIRTASGASGATFHFEVDGVDVTGSIKTTGTGGWQTWQTTTVNQVILPEGDHQVKLVFDKAGCNVNYFKFYEPTAVVDATFGFLSAQTYQDGWQVALIVNKEVTSESSTILLNEFMVKVDNESASLTGVSVNPDNKRMVLLSLESKVNFKNVLSVSYNGSSVVCGTQLLPAFTDKVVLNTLPTRHLIPGKIQAEKFDYNNGLQLEDCSDTGGGQNTGYANNGDYLDYLVLVNASGDYKFNFRVACTTTNRKLTVQLADSNQVTDLGTITFTNTGGWQTWNTQSMVLPLTNGEHRLRLYITMGEFNLNWFEATVYTDIEQPESNTGLNIFPNPVKNDLQIQLNENIRTDAHISIMNVMGQTVMTSGMENTSQTFKVGFLAPGIYFVEVVNSQQRMIQRIIKE